ncbi:MAG: transketolase [Chloroflexota bacterium]|nr:transketolase [Chloroflexota bacterium]NOG62571.1 transketolase [Chloroflexota bacterium]GIK63221.1 MAG: transketolase [Chloroflexota bacterium]
MTTQSLDNRAINTIRFLAVDAVQKANSGHPGLPMGAAAMAYVLWTRFLKHNPSNPKWPDRDRFVLSAGHGSMLLYALLHLTGYDLPLDELKNFRQWGSKTPGHPEYGHTPGVETTTGPLGQGFGNAVGMAVAEAFLAARFNRNGHKVVDHYTYAIVSDGDVMEGVAQEAASLAGHLKLGKLIMLYDDNRITLAAPADVTFSEDVPKRFEAYGWHTLKVEDGNDLDAIAAAIQLAQKVTDKPSLISVRTIIGYGSPKKAGTYHAHGSPLGPDEVKASKENLGWPLEPDFLIPQDVRAHFLGAVERGKAAEADWQHHFAAYETAYTDLAIQFRRAQAGQLPDAWDFDIPKYGPNAKGMATRNASGQILNAIAKRVPTFMGGDADLAESTKTLIDGEGNFGVDGYDQRNLRFGIREHAMGSIANGLALHGGIIKPYTATFLVFSDYMRPTIRLAALSGIEPIFVFTHDSIGLGEDGPTHQPVEHLAALRTIPNSIILRPADANESAAAWKVAMEHKGGPVTLVFTRQNVPILEQPVVWEGVPKGGYVLSDSEDEPDVLLMSTGSEVQLILKAQELLAQDGIQARVISIPSMELFEAQGADYIQSVLPPNVKARVAVEAGVKQGWQEYLQGGHFIGLNRFGASAPYEQIYQNLGITAEAVVEAAKMQVALQKA